MHTRGACWPRSRRASPCPAPAGAEEVVRATDAKVWFPIKRGLLKRTVGHVKAVDGISLRLRAGHTLGVVGESGSGKSTLGRALLRLTQSQGSIVFEGRELQGLSWSAVRPLRRRMQIVFQDPYGSLSPRMTVGQIVGEGLKIDRLGSADERRSRIEAALTRSTSTRRCRTAIRTSFPAASDSAIAIARALVLKPDFIVLDEPTSALDMSVQAQIVELLRALQRAHGLAYLFISHDLKVIRALAHDVLVMRAGRVVEQGPAEEIFERPRDPYTRALIAAAFELRTAEVA